MAEPTQEDIFNNDIDPLDGIRALRKEEEENLPQEEEESVDTPEPETEPETESEPEAVADSDDEPVDGEPVDDTPEDVLSENTSEDEPSEDDASVDVLDLTEVRKYTANGQDFEFTVGEILDKFGTVFGQSMDYTKKTQAIAPYRKMISALEEQNISQEQLNVAIDALKGDKGAIKQLMDNHNIESYDLANNDENSPYTPSEYGKDEETLNLQEVVNTISADAEYATTANVVQNQWDVNSQQQLASNPAFLQGLHNDVKSGVYAQVAPLAAKMKVYDGNTKSDIEYYMLAGQELSKQKEAANTANQEAAKLNKKTQDEIDKADRASSEANKKRSASSTASRSDRTVIDYLDDDDEAFDDWYKQVMSSQ